jgi:hypothetical protein
MKIHRPGIDACRHLLYSNLNGHLHGQNITTIMYVTRKYLAWDRCMRMYIFTLYSCMILIVYRLTANSQIHAMACMTKPKSLGISNSPRYNNIIASYLSQTSNSLYIDHARTL